MTPQPVELQTDETPLERAHREFLTGCPWCRCSWKLHFDGGEYVDCQDEGEE